MVFAKKVWFSGLILPTTNSPRMLSYVSFLSSQQVNLSFMLIFIIIGSIIIRKQGDHDRKGAITLQKPTFQKFEKTIFR